jgi:hypothetical protein
MEAAGWLRGRLSIGLLTLLVTTTLAGSRVLGAGDTPWDPPPCPGGTPGSASPGPATRAWFRMTPTLDDTGTLNGQRLTLGLPGHRVAEIDLPPESFATGPVQGRLVVGDDDGLRSRLRIVDLVLGCVRASVTETAVIRSAVLAGDGDVWEHRVDRATRDDMGVWRRTIDGEMATRVLPGVVPDAVNGPTFVTDLRWSPDGHLVVASCGQLVCRTRILDPATDGVVDLDGTGPAIGVAAGRLVAFDACADAQCPIVAIDPSSGARTVLIDAAGPAELGGPDGTILVAASEHGLERLDVATGAGGLLDVDVRLAPVGRGSVANAGADLPAGQLLLAPDGRLDDASDARSIDPASEAVEPLEEVQP